MKYLIWGLLLSSMAFGQAIDKQKEIFGYVDQAISEVNYLKDKKDLKSISNQVKRKLNKLHEQKNLYQLDHFEFAKTVMDLIAQNDEDAKKNFEMVKHFQGRLADCEMLHSGQKNIYSQPDYESFYWHELTEVGQDDLIKTLVKSEAYSASLYKKHLDLYWQVNACENQPAKDSTYVHTPYHLDLKGEFGDPEIPLSEEGKDDKESPSSSGSYQ